eukprot:6349704-Prymnesium_polylepis.1
MARCGSMPSLPKDGGPREWRLSCIQEAPRSQWSAGRNMPAGASGPGEAPAEAQHTFNTRPHRAIHLLLRLLRPLPALLRGLQQGITALS